MKDHTAVVTVGIDAEREGHAEFIVDEMLRFIEENYPKNIKDYRVVLWNDQAEPVTEWVKR